MGHTLELVARCLRALALHHPETAEHCLRVARISTRLGVKYRTWDDEELAALTNGAALHDVGKTGVPVNILDSTAPLTREEWEILRRHPDYGARMVRGYKELRHSVQVIRHHHERWDGRGYPSYLRGQRIPLGARIVCIADAYDAMVSDRPYSAGISHEEAMQRIEIAAGTQFDPGLVQVFRLLSEEELSGGAVG